jgi:hypothetical protein
MNQVLLSSSRRTRKVQLPLPSRGMMSRRLLFKRLPHAVAAFHYSNGLLWPRTTAHVMPTDQVIIESRNV